MESVTVDGKQRSVIGANLDREANRLMAADGLLSYAEALREAATRLGKESW